MSGPMLGRGARWALAVSAAVYRLLVRVRYDAALRRRFGDDMAALFRTVLADEMRRGTVRGLVAGWTRVIRDLARSNAVSGTPAARTRRKEGRWRGVADDARQALRSIARDPRFAALVVLVPAVGLALTIAVFAVVNAYLLQPLPYPESDRLVSVRGASAAELSWDELDDIFERGVSWDLDVFSTVGEGGPELLFGAWVTPSFLEVYDVRPAIGRGFLPEEGRARGAPVALISDRLWRERFGSDPAILGRTFSAYMSDRPDAPGTFTVIGVLPPDFWYFNHYTDVLVPIVEPRPIYTGRLRQGVPIERARDVLTRLAHGRNPDLPDDFVVEVESSRELHVAEIRPTLLVLQAAVLLVLLIACVNTAVLLLVRAAGRERELGVRRALGAASGRLASQLVVEGLLLAALAGLIGVLLATVGLSGVAELVETRIGRSVPGGPGALRVDGTVLLATTVLCTAIGVLFGLVPLLASARMPLASVLGEVGRGGTDSRRRQRARGAMVAAEVALSLALLTAAGLMVRSAINLQREDLGFTAERVVRGQVGLRQASYPNAADQIAFFDRLIDDVRALPSVEAAGLVSVMPFSTRFGTAPVGSEATADGTTRTGDAVSFVVGEGWFRTMGIALTAGRDFTTADVAGSEPVAIVSEALARRLWPGDNPIGRRVRPLPLLDGGMDAEPGPWLRVVGIVRDFRRDAAGTPPGDLYTTMRQGGRLWMNVIARATPGAQPSAVLASMEEVLHRIDPVVPLATPLVLEEAVREARAPTRFLATLLVGFAAFALLLALVGLYGVVAYAARQRRRDVAIRVALGADRGNVAGLFVRQGLVVVVAGVALGSGGGYLLGRALEGQLHGVAPGDPLTHVALAALLLVTAGTAVWLPARQAAATDPMRVLREE